MRALLHGSGLLCDRRGLHVGDLAQPSGISVIPMAGMRGVGHVRRVALTACAPLAGWLAELRRLGLVGSGGGRCQPAALSGVAGVISFQSGTRCLNGGFVGSSRGIVQSLR